MDNRTDGDPITEKDKRKILFDKIEIRQDI